MHKTYNSEAEFLKDYNPKEFDSFALTCDILVFSIADEEQDNYRKLSEKKFSILLLKRDNYPFKDKWSLPGSFVGVDESLSEAAHRILKQETNLSDIYIEQLYTFGDPARDPRMRVVSSSYLALIDKNRIKEKIAPWASWFNITFSEDKKNIKFTLENGREKMKCVIAKILRDRSTDRYDYKIEADEGLAFDHARMIAAGLTRLKNKIEYTDIVFNMMPEMFTLSELQQVYEIILGVKLLDPAFRRMIASKVEKTGKMKTGAGHRPSALFRYKKAG